MTENYKNREKIYDAEVLESSTFDENIIIKILIKAGRTIAKPALEVLEMAIDPFTPAQVRVSLMAPPMELAELAERTASAWKLLDKANLTEKERKIVSLRFGLDGSNEWRTLAEVARYMSCSREYCRQVVQRALRKLRKAGIQNGLVDSIS